MHTTIIAEAGVNHNGSMTLAKQMVEKAKQAGADYVKFQTFVPEKLVSRFAQKAEYQKKNDRSGRVAASDVTEAGIDAGGFYKTAGVL